MHELLFDSLPGPTFLLNAQRRITRANRAARALFGDACATATLSTVLRNPPLLDAVERAMRGEAGGASSSPRRASPKARSAPSSSLCRGRRSTARWRWWRCTTSPRSRRVEQMRADFVANASHELRTPLAALLGFIETLQGPAKDDGEARKRFLGIMHEQAGRMSRLVADLLTLSRIELSEHSRPIGRVDLGVILRARLRNASKLQAATSACAWCVEVAGRPAAWSTARTTSSRRFSRT